MTYEIIKDVPLPKDVNDGRRSYPFQDMEVGDCFRIPNTNDPLILNRVRVAASLYGKRHDKYFTVRVSTCDITTWRVR